MKTIILAALLAVSAVATGTAPAFADSSLTVHGVLAATATAAKIYQPCVAVRPVAGNLHLRPCFFV